MSTCANCSGPIPGPGHAGRPWPGRPAAAYCCFGCLSLGEHRHQDATAPGAARPAGGVGFRLGIGILVVGQSMIFGLALNLHDDVPAPVRRGAETLILAATVLVTGLLGGPLLRAAWHELRRGRLTIEALFLLTLTGAMAASLQAHVTGRGKIYFEVVSVLLVVYTLGKVIGARARAAAVAGSRAWADQLATCQLVDAAGRVRTVPVTEIRPGDTVAVDPGGMIAVDGVIRQGTGFVSEAPVSGEPFAVVRRPGDRVLAGTASHDAAFHIEAAGPGRQIDQLVAAVAAARDRPVPFQGQADRVGRAVFPLVVLVALGTFGYWAAFTSAGWEAGLFNAMSVLLVACPCVIGLAAPIVIWSAVGHLAERGLIVRSGTAVDQLAEIDHVLFDKTGTLTDERFTLVDIVTPTAGTDRARVLGWVGLVEACSAHPVAKPFAQLPRPFPPGEEPRVAELKAIPGCGVEATIGDEGGTRRRIAIGRPEWVAGALTSPPSSTFLAGVERRAATDHRIDVAIDGELAAVAVVAERLRDSVPAMLADLRALGVTVEVLTGDTAGRAAALGLPPTRAGLLPADKRARIDALKAGGAKPLMVGDGINDASALAAAHVGVALASGTDLAVGAAAVTLYHNDLRVLPWAIALSRAAVRAVRRNLYRALAYNLIGMALAAGGLLHPVAAALLMTASSLSLIVSSTRVGVIPDHCSGPPAPRRPGRRWLTPSAGRAAVHAAALALQGVVVVLLLGAARDGPVTVAVVGGFTLAGIVLARVWQRWEAIPHTLDMAFGMVTLGNLGMLLGWWADNDFAPLHDAGCCACVAAAPGGMTAPGMWTGMLLFATAAMLWAGRRPLPRGGGHVPAMLTGGNLGMVAGMAAGGWVAGSYPAESVSVAVMFGVVGMTAGMIAGMLLGTWAAEGAITVGRAVWPWRRTQGAEGSPAPAKPGAGVGVGGSNGPTTS